MPSLQHGFQEPGNVQDIRLVVDTIPTLAWSARPDGSVEFLNQRWLDYTGLMAKQALGSGWQVAIHPDDLQRILEAYREALNSVKPFEVEGRFRRFDGEFRWFLQMCSSTLYGCFNPSEQRAAQRAVEVCELSAT